MSAPQGQSQKATPGRRQPQRHGRSTKTKGYASENDAGMFDVAQARQVPRTPNKAGSGSPAPGNTQPGTGTNKQRTRGKGKPKAAQTSPDEPQYHSTPPQQTAAMKAAAGPAFAGATFHASPAPSALPIPSFLTKSSTESPVPRPVADLSTSRSVRDSPVDARATSAQPSNGARESPLDFMFRAHRQEKERMGAGGASPGQSGASVYASTMSQTPPYSSGIDRVELDGTPGRDIGPAFSTPYQDRINATRTMRSGTERGPASLENSSSFPRDQPDDASEALKRYLFGGPAKPANSQPLQPQPSHPSQSHQSYQPTSYVPNMAPQGLSNPSDSIQTMEDSLRRILKLDLAVEPSSSGRQYIPHNP